MNRIVEAMKKHASLLPKDARDVVIQHFAQVPIRQSPAVNPGAIPMGRPTVAPPNPAGVMKTTPQAPKPQAPKRKWKGVPQGVRPTDQGFASTDWNDESKAWVRDRVWEVLEDFFNTNNLTDRSIPVQDINAFLSKVDGELTAMLNSPAYGQTGAATFSTPFTTPNNIEHNVTDHQMGATFSARINKIKDIEAALLALADEADKSGRTEDGDKIASVLPLTSMLRFAQYESANPYWIMNGRAFEMALREKRRKNKKQDDTKANDPEHYNSWHESWFEVLDEYQDALMGEHADFLKYASCGDSSVEMSKDMTDTHDENFEDGEHIEKWLEEQEKKDKRPDTEKKKERTSAARFFFDKVADKIEDGRSPGVAFYESMDEVTSGAYLADIAAKIAGTIDDIKMEAEKSGNAAVVQKATEASTKIAGFWSGLGGMLGNALSPLEWGAEKAYDAAGELGYGFHGGRAGGGKATELAARIRDIAPLVWGQIKAIRESGTPVDSKQFSETIAKVFPLVDAYSKEANKAGYRLPPPGTFKYTIESQDSVGPEQIESVASMWRQFNTWADEDRAREIQQKLNKRMQTIKNRKSPQKWQNTQKPMNWSQNPDMAKQLFEAMKANLPKVKNPYLQRRIREKMKDLIVASGSGWKVSTAAPILPKKPLAPANPIPAIVSPNQAGPQQPVPVKKPKIPSLAVRPQSGIPTAAPQAAPTAPAPVPAPAAPQAPVGAPDQKALMRSEFYGVPLPNAAPAAPPAQAQAPLDSKPIPESAPHNHALDPVEDAPPDPDMVSPLAPSGPLSTQPQVPTAPVSTAPESLPGIDEIPMTTPLGDGQVSFAPQQEPQAPQAPQAQPQVSQKPAAPKGQMSPELNQVRNWMSSNFGTAGAREFIEGVMQQLQATGSPGASGSVPGKS